MLIAWQVSNSKYVVHIMFRMLNLLFWQCEQYFFRSIVCLFLYRNKHLLLKRKRLHKPCNVKIVRQYILFKFKSYFTKWHFWCTCINVSDATNFVFRIIYRVQSILNCLIFSDIWINKKMSKVFADFFTSYKICKVLCTITEFTWKDIARMNQNHEDGIKRQQILVGMFFSG